MRVETIRQTEAAECGLACLAIVSGIHGAHIDLATLRRRHPVSNRGLTLQDIARTASSMDLTTRALRCEVEEIGDIQRPAILHWGLSHFVVLKQVVRGGIIIIDPARGVRRVSAKEFHEKFSGVVLELAKSPSFRKRKERSPLKLTTLFQWSPTVWGGLGHVLILSLLLQAYVIASPLYMQMAIDEAALKGDRGLLMALALGFGLFGLFNIGASAMRGVAVQKLSAIIGWDMTRRLFHHFIRLPLPWFQRRRLADALSRFDSLAPIRQIFSNGLVSSLLDGLLSIVTLIMMFVFSWKLGIVVVAGLVAYIGIRLVSIPISIRLSSDALAATIAEEGKRIETLRAIQTIKVMGAESERENNWANNYAETVRTGQTNTFANIGFTSLQGLTDTVTNAIVIYLGAVAIIENSMTVGVLYAFMSYKQQFSKAAQNMFDTFVNWRMLDLHSERVADIALHPMEKGLEDAGVGLPEMKGEIEIRNLGFRYAPQDGFVFQNANTKIKAGEFVAVVGPSGAGKSTLIKVICGLYPSTAGQVHIDGLPLVSWGTGTVRRNLGVVMQDDELISGSIAENVAFFSDNINMDKVWACLRLASIEDEVQAMPMRAETFVGDMGSSLSGGQKQRVLLARALYRNPKILVLDEATSHLDVVRERSINDALKALSITRLVVAHRPETIAAADRVLIVMGGQIVEREAAPNRGGSPVIDQLRASA